MATSPERFNIPGDLLAGPEGDGRWTNLGYWKSAQNYTEACRALAEIHGVAAGLTASSRLLELACGHGAALDLWYNRFGVTQISALEYRPDCVQRIAERNHSRVARVAQGRFDLPLLRLFGEERFDAVICVDAAYHASSLEDFLESSLPQLADGGVMVFSTLVRPDAPKQVSALWRWLSSGLLRLAAIPESSIMTLDAIQSVLEKKGMTATYADLSPGVFSGFSQWVNIRRKDIGFRQRLSRDWLKVEAVAMWAQWLVRKPAWRYLLIKASRSRGV